MHGKFPRGLGSRHRGSRKGGPEYDPFRDMPKSKGAPAVDERQEPSFRAPPKGPEKAPQELYIAPVEVRVVLEVNEDGPAISAHLKEEEAEQVETPVSPPPADSPPKREVPKRKPAPLPADLSPAQQQAFVAAQDEYRQAAAERKAAWKQVEAPPLSPGHFAEVVGDTPSQIRPHQELLLKVLAERPHPVVEVPPVEVRDNPQLLAKLADFLGTAPEASAKETPEPAAPTPEEPAEAEPTGSPPEEQPATPAAAVVEDPMDRFRPPPVWENPLLPKSYREQKRKEAEEAGVIPKPPLE